MKIKIKRKFIFTVIVFTLSFVVNNNLPSRRLQLAYAQDKIIAIVNQDVITQKDLADFLNFMRLQLSSDYKGKELEEKIQGMKVALLSRLIDDRLILQEAKKNNIVIDEGRIKAKINEVKREYPTESHFHAELMKQGLTQGDIEKKLREQSMMFSIIDQKVRSKIIIKPDEVTEFYESNKKEFNTGEGRTLEVVSLDNLDLANTVAYELKSGKKVSDLASRYPLVVNNITINRNSGARKEIIQVVSELGLNEVSAPLRVEGRYYIFKLINLIPPEELTLLQAQRSIHSILFEKKMQEEMTKWLAEIKKNSYVKIMQD